MRFAVTHPLVTHPYHPDRRDPSRDGEQVVAGRPDGADAV